jgi:nicotinamide mononucleotide (NMN) deamidase PncC
LDCLQKATAANHRRPKTGKLNFVMESAQQRVIERVHGSGNRLVLSITGGGSGAIAALLEVPGASASVLEAVVPYAPAALEHWLGGPVDQHCSERTARAMAMAAFERARRLSGVDPRTLRGIGATASLVTTRPKRGEHRIHAAWQSAVATAVATCELAKGQRTRAEEEQIATQLILDTVAEACEIDETTLLKASVGDSVQRRTQRALETWTQVLLGERAAIEISHGATNVLDANVGSPEPSDVTILFPGAFNPLHWGHERMAELAAERYGRPVTFELSIANVDKPPLDFIELAERLEQLAGRRVLLTRAATFVEKARLLPRCVFVIGADTLVRIADPRYYGDDLAKRDTAISELAALGCRFLVFGRSVEGRFQALSELNVPAALRALCEDISESQFRANVSSSELRDR